MSLIRKNFLLVMIFLLALFLRLYKLPVLPWGFYEEEVTNAYVGRFILANGVDLYGNRWPLLYFDKFGDYPPVLPMYLAGLATYLFGFNEFAARFPAAFLGALTIFPVYGLALLVFKNQKLSLFAALLLAIAPWHVVLSRTSAEGVMALAVYALALPLCLRAVEEKNTRKIWMALGLFLLTYFFYPSFRLLVPLSLLGLPLVIRPKTKPGQKLLWSLAAISLLLTLAISLTTWGKGRFLQTSIFQSPEVAEHVALRIQALSYGEGSGNVLTARIFHNKAVEYGKAFLEQYLSYFSPSHLFLEALGQHRYFNVPYQGLLFLTTGLLLLMGLLPGGSLFRPPLIRYLLYLLLIAPLPAALTIDFPPHVHRSIFLLYPLIFLTTYGLAKLSAILNNRRLAGGIIALLLTLEGIYFWHQYAVHSDSVQSILRNDGDREVVHYVIANQNRYDKVVLPMFARLPVYYLYFSGRVDRSLAGRFKNELKIDGVGKVEFFGDWCPSKMLDISLLPKRTLVIDNASCPSEGLPVVETIMRRDSTAAYRIQTKP